MISGKLIAKDAEVTLNFGRNMQITHKYTATLKVVLSLFLFCSSDIFLTFLLSFSLLPLPIIRHSFVGPGHRANWPTCLISQLATTWISND
jgi:hypothetical protein